MKKGKLIFFLFSFLLVFFMGVAGALYLSTSVFGGDNRSERSVSFVEKVRNINKLATVEVYMRTAYEGKDNQFFGNDIKWDLPGTGREYLLVVPGTVTAGVDLANIEESDVVVDEEAQTVEITVPEAAILQGAVLDLPNAQTLTSDGIFANEVDMAETIEFTGLLQEQMEAEAIEQGILEKAEENAETALKELFDFTGYEATITFSE